MTFSSLARNAHQAIFALTFVAVAGSTSTARAECNPSGTENQIIGCIDEANGTLKTKLSVYYSTYLDQLAAKCAAQNPGGGSGGHADRATCLQTKLKAESSRIGLPQ